MLRHSPRDALLVLAALGQGALAAALVARSRDLGAPGLVTAACLVAVGVWWNSNTISHNHLHNPFFRSRALNRAFAGYLSLLLGIPQSLWRARHLWHHAGEPAGSRARFGATDGIEALLVASLWGALLALSPRFFLAAYLPGYLAGLGLCWMQGHFEHARAVAGGISFHNRFYNVVWFNDGFHAEHHRRPGEHWSRLPTNVEAGTATSRLPPVLRWAEADPIGRAAAWCLERLEEIALGSPRLQRLMIASHARAFRALGPSLGAPRRVGIVGGGLFPRTALVLREVLPPCELVIIDRSAASVARARAFLEAHGVPGVGFVEAAFDPARHGGFDLLVLPLAYLGDRDAVYDAPPASKVVVHDWLWRRRGTSAIVSLLLFKRLNLVERKVRDAGDTRET